jgi:hypothetical protein
MAATEGDMSSSVMGRRGRDCEEDIGGGMPCSIRPRAISPGARFRVGGPVDLHMAFRVNAIAEKRICQGIFSGSPVGQRHLQIENQILKCRMFPVLSLRSVQIIGNTSHYFILIPLHLSEPEFAMQLKSLYTSALIALLPHLDTLNLQRSTSSIGPCRIPGTLRIPKIIHCARRCVNPRFIRHVVREITVSSSNRQT